MEKQASAIWRVGTSGLVLPVPNKQAFPEAFRTKSRLTYYASLFSTIEINSSFYKIPMPGTFEKWSASVPEHFRFTVKLWRGITHKSGLRFSPTDIQRFMEAANRIDRNKKGCILIQLPPSAAIDMSAQLEAILKKIKVADPEHSWKIAVEFRSRTWYTRATRLLLQQFDACIVQHDMPASGTAGLSAGIPGVNTVHATAPNQEERDIFIYTRFHGPEGDYKGSYSDEFLQAYSRCIKSWLDEGRDVYTYFNNTIGDAIGNLTTLTRLVVAS